MSLKKEKKLSKTNSSNMRIWIQATKLKDKQLLEVY